MNVVTDTNIFLSVALNEPEKERIIRLTPGTQAVAPEILPYELGYALTAMFKRQRISLAEAQSAFEIASRIPVRLLEVDIQKSLRLAMDFSLYAYDAYFLQCAKYLSCPLITLDRRMQQVATDLGIELLE